MTPLGEGRFSLELPLTVAPEQLLAELVAAGGRLVSLNPVRETLEDFFVQQVRATDEAGIVRERSVIVTAILIVARGVFRDSIRDRIPYNLVFFAVLLMAASFLLAQLTAGQDVKIIKDLGLAAGDPHGCPHRGLHRHRPGDEGGRAQKHLQSAVEAGHAQPVHPRQIPGSRPDPRGQSRGHGDRLLRCSGLSRLADPCQREAGVGSAGDRSQTASSIRADWRRADARHRPRVVLLDLLEHVSVCGADARDLRHRSLQRRPAEHSNLLAPRRRSR